MEDVALREIVIVEVPEGVISGGGGAIAALPPPQPEKMKAAKKMMAGRSPQKARQFFRVAGWNACRLLPKNASNKKKRARKIGVGRGARESGGRRRGTEGVA